MVCLETEPDFRATVFVQKLFFILGFGRQTENYFLEAEREQSPACHSVYLHVLMYIIPTTRATPCVKSLVCVCTAKNTCFVEVCFRLRQTQCVCVRKISVRKLNVQDDHMYVFCLCASCFRCLHGFVCA